MRKATSILYSPNENVYQSSATNEHIHTTANDVQTAKITLNRSAGDGGGAAAHKHQMYTDRSKHTTSIESSREPRVK